VQAVLRTVFRDIAGNEHSKDLRTISYKMPAETGYLLIPVSGRELLEDPPGFFQWLSRLQLWLLDKLGGFRKPEGGEKTAPPKADNRPFEQALAAEAQKYYDWANQGVRYKSPSNGTPDMWEAEKKSKGSAFDPSAYGTDCVGYAYNIIDAGLKGAGKPGFRAEGRETQVGKRVGPRFAGKEERKKTDISCRWILRMWTIQSMPT
jgi:hypothetical protein